MSLGLIHATRPSPRRRLGFSLIEVLVVIGIIGILAGLLFPAVQSAREAARRATCANHLRQFGLAMQSYASAWSVFPPWTIGVRGIIPGQSAVSTPASAQVLLLPYLEQPAIYAAINLEDRWYAFEPHGAGNATVARMRIGLFLCPNDAEALRADTGSINYRTNNGLSQVPPEWNRGAFVEGANSLASFTDGLSHTVAMSEKLVGSGRDHHFNGLRDWIFAPRMVIPGTADDWLACCSNLTSTAESRGNGGSSWLIGGAIYTGYYHAAPPNTEIPDCGAPTSGDIGIFSARSFHPGLVNTVYADGSVRPARNGISLAVWRALGTRNGGELEASDMDQ